MTIYDGKHKRCIVCAKKAAHDLTLDDALCMKCDDALERWMKSEHFTHSGPAGIPGWIARRVRAHERKKHDALKERAFQAGLHCRLVGKGGT